MSVTLITTQKYQKVSTGGPPSFLTSDGYTTGWFDYAEAGKVTTTEYEGLYYVTQWIDRRAATPILTGYSNEEPTLHADGIWVKDLAYGNVMMQGAFTLIQPTTLYIVVKQIDWVSVNTLMDGYNADGRLRQNNTEPGLMASAGHYSTQNDNLAMNTWGIIRIVFNDTASTFQINNTAEINFDAGPANMGGITIGNVRGGGLPVESYWKEVICRSGVEDTDANWTDVFNYLNAKWSLGLT